MRLTRRVLLASMVLVGGFSSQGVRAGSEGIQAPLRARCLACGHLYVFGGYAVGGDCDTPGGRCSI
jgi:hypothetical protein